MPRSLSSLAFLAIGIAASTAFADPPGLKPLAIGSPAPGFRLPGVEGQWHDLHEFDGPKVLVVELTCKL